MSGKVRTSANRMAYAQGTFLWWGLCIPCFRNIAYVIEKQSGICRRYILLQGLYVPIVKTTTYVSNRFNTSSCTKGHKTHQATSNLNQKFWTKNSNLGGLSTGSFLHPCPTEITSLKTMLSFESTYISCILYIRLLWPICLNEIFEQNIL